MIYSILVIQGTLLMLLLILLTRSQQVGVLLEQVMEILEQHRPETLGQARRISGITPAAISLLLVHFKKHHALRTAA